MTPNRRPITSAILLTLLILLFPILSGTVIVLGQLDGLQPPLVQAAAFLLAAMIGVAIDSRLGTEALSSMARPRGSLRSANPTQLLYVVPLIVVEAIPLIFGLRTGLSVGYLIVFLLFACIVGFTEELYFRGLIANILRPKGFTAAVLLSALLFSVGHFANLLAGAEPVHTLFQVLLAFSFGLTAVLIFFGTGSLAIPMVWHAAHNFIVYISADSDPVRTIYLGAAQVVVMLLYSAYLWAAQRRRQPGR